MQREAGVPGSFADRAGSAIRDHMREQHRLFFPQLPFAVLGAVDPDGAAWATIQTGAPGFLSSPDEHTLHIDCVRDPADPADRGMDQGDAVGLLGIEFTTRRRNRLNGILRRASSQGYDIAVEQSFGNCARFIWPRRHAFARSSGTPSSPDSRRLDRLDTRALSLIIGASTFFVASYTDLENGRRQVDVSHRGGPAGFVAVSPCGELVIPDYPGNNYFNTLGNLRLNGRVGLLFVDFHTGDLLQLSGAATIKINEKAGGHALDTGRCWTVSPERIVSRHDALPLRWTDA